MQVSIVYAKPERPYWQQLDVPEGSSVADVIECSGILTRFPEIDLAHQKVGIFGKLTKLDTKVNPGDRVEIYHSIIADPKKVQRRNRGDKEAS